VSIFGTPRKALCNGQMKEMVMLPLLPEGHFDVDAEDISGVSMVEIIAVICEDGGQAGAARPAKETATDIKLSLE
jgi:hypothetical protein